MSSDNNGAAPAAGSRTSDELTTPPVERGLVKRIDSSAPSYLPDIHRLLPQSEDAEKGVLCSFFREPDKTGKLCLERGIRAEHFHIPAHATIYGVMLWMFEDRLDEIDIVTVSEQLRGQGKLDAVGGPAFIMGLPEFVGTAANAGRYLEMVEEAWALRETIRVCTEAAARSYDAKADATTLLDEVRTKIEAITEQRTNKGTGLPALCDLSKMLGEAKPPRPPELVRGLLHQGSKLIIGGTSKGRKTYSLLDLAISIATGTRWWNFECQKGRVCYINFEIQEAFFCARVEDICRAKDVTLEAGMLMGWMLRGRSEGIELMVAQLMSVLLRERFVLIIFDPIYKALGNRDENKAGDVASLCNELERIAVRTGAAIAFGAHYSKGNQAAKESIDRIGGSGVFARDPDAILTMTAHEEDECFTVEATLRNFPPLEPFVVKWDWPLFRHEEGADPAALKKPKNGRESSYTEDDVLAPLRDGAELTTTEWQEAVEEECGMKARTFYTAKKKLIAGKKVRKSKLSGKWTLT